MGNLRRIASEFGGWPCLEAVRAAGGTVRRRSLTALARRVGPALPLSRLGPLLPASPLPGLSAGAPDSASLRQVRMLAEDMSKAGANIQSQKYKAWFKVHDDECEDEDGRLPSSDGEEEDETPPAGVASSWHPEMRPGPVSSVEGCSALRRGAGPAADCSRPCLPSRGVQAGARRAEAASGAPPPRTSASTSRVANRSHDAVCRAGRAAQRAEHRAHHRDREPRELSEHRALAASVLGEGREAAPTPAGRGRAGQRYADLRLEAQTCRRLLLLTPICYLRLGPRLGQRARCSSSCAPACRAGCCATCSSRGSSGRLTLPCLETLAGASTGWWHAAPWASPRRARASAQWTRRAVARTAPGP